MNKALLLPFAVTLGLGLAGTGLVLFAWELPPFSASAPTTENAYIRGKVTAVSPQIAGYIAEVLVTDFQKVAEGDVLFRLDNSTQKAKLQQAEAGLAAALANHAGAEQTLRAAELGSKADESRLTAAELALATAQAEYSRQHSLQERGVLSNSATEQADLSLSKAQAGLAEVEAALASKAETIGALKNSVSAANAAISQAQAAVALAQIDLNHTEITAPADGMMGQISARVGQYVNAATALASHVGDERWVIANFTEINVERLAVDQPVTVSVDALGHRSLTGRIASFSPATASEFSLMAGTNATGNFTKVVQRLPVRIELDPDQPLLADLMPGMSVVVVAQD